MLLPEDLFSCWESVFPEDLFLYNCLQDPGGLGPAQLGQAPPAAPPSRSASPNQPPAAPAADTRGAADAAADAPAAVAPLQPLQLRGHGGAAVQPPHGHGRQVPHEPRHVRRRHWHTDIFKRCIFNQTDLDWPVETARLHSWSYLIIVPFLIFQVK